MPVLQQEFVPTWGGSCPVCRAGAGHGDAISSTRSPELHWIWQTPAPDRAAESGVGF